MQNSASSDFEDAYIFISKASHFQQFLNCTGTVAQFLVPVTGSLTVEIFGKYFHANLGQIYPCESVGNKSTQIFGKYIRAMFQEEFPRKPLQRIS